MSFPTRICLFLCTSMLFVLMTGGCNSTPPPAPPTITLLPPASPTQTAAAAPGNSPTLLAFPTAPPVTSTVPSATVTLDPGSPLTPVLPITPALPVTRTAGGAPPVLQVVSPLTNTQVSVNQTIYVVAFAASENLISRVELSVDNLSVHTEQVRVPVGTFSALMPWTPTQIGSYVLRVTAFDSGNVPSVPEEVPVQVTPDIRRPTASIIYPLGTPQVELGSVLQIYAVATDEVGVRQVDLWVDDKIYTYVVPQSPTNQTSFPIVFNWTALGAGNHTLYIRSHDNQGQTTDSAQLKVFVADTHAPALQVNFDRTNTGVGEPITITIAALDVAGIQKIEFWSGREMSSTFTSANPARQTSMTLQWAWQQGNPGDYAVSVRAYNALGNMRESPAQVISVLRPGQSTPTPAPTPTVTRTRAPRATPTPRLQPPAPPTIEISEPVNGFSNLYPIRVVVNSKANTELLRLEVWAFYQNQLSPQVICTIDAQATTQKVSQCDWSPSHAGLVFIYAQAIDKYNQVGRSETIYGVINVPALPTPAPTPASLAGRWNANTPSGQFIVLFRPVATASGTALRGDFRAISTATPVSDSSGRISSGSIRGDRVTFRVEFTPLAPATSTVLATSTLVPTTGTPPPEAPSPTPSVGPTAAPALDFECTLDASATTLDCKYKDARGQTNSATFRREP